MCEGVCRQIATDPNNCGVRGRECADGEACCGGVCKAVQTDAANCGACGVTCGSGKVCTNGSCVCAPGTQTCNGMCGCFRTNSLGEGACGCRDDAECLDAFGEGFCRKDAFAACVCGPLTPNGRNGLCARACRA